MDLERSLGLNKNLSTQERHQRLQRYLDLKLAALGLPHRSSGDDAFLEVAHDLLANHQERGRRLAEELSPIDARIQDFLDRYLADLKQPVPRLPARTLTLDRHGLARMASLPPDRDEFKNSILTSVRVRQGILHNPAKDRRTTVGVFHVCAGGLPVADDKKEVPKLAFLNLLAAALNPPKDLQVLPYTSTCPQPASTWVSLMLRPEVCPAIPRREAAKSMEVRFLAPGGMVCNLDFVESIFGNAGDPFLPENDAALDVEHWTGTTGCVILATHLITLKKKDLGLPHISAATEREKRDGMCWEREDELYNNGTAFKVCARTAEGVVVTLIADNYFGYCKKEVKTQISYSANLTGLAEEEHAGGALAFPSYNHGDQFHIDSRVAVNGQSFSELIQQYASMIEVKPEGYAVDRQFSDIFYIPEDARFDRLSGTVSWQGQTGERSIPLRFGITYIYPSGYKIRLEQHPASPTWRLIGTRAEGLYCHKPCTVSGGGKSEISKSLTDAIIYGPIFVNDFKADMDRIQELFERDYQDRLLPHLRQDYSKIPSRKILSSARTLGSVIKLFTPSPGEFTAEYNAWLASIPNYLKALLFIIKRFYKQEWGNDWRSHFSVDCVNGKSGHELRYHGRKLVASYLRVGVDAEGSWLTHKLRQDFMPADKVQMEDDISASVVVPAQWLPNRPPSMQNPSVKLADNCEYRFFQRPDDAIHRGYDKQAEADIGGEDVFLSNWQPLSSDDAQKLVEDAMGFNAWTKPMQEMIRGSAEAGKGFVCSSAHPRMVDGKPSKNPRYLQTRPSLLQPRDRYLADLGARLFRRVPVGEPVLWPVGGVMPGRRLNPAADGVRPLAVFNPIHYQELPELFIDFICSLTGKSPSTTGAGSEGALTKGPFNCLLPATDINNMLIGMILCGYPAFSSAAGFVGPFWKVDHDISLLMPELFARLDPQECEPQKMIADGHLEAIGDFKHGDRTVLASRLGYRITEKFIHTYFGRVFDQPEAVFSPAMLRPESQDLEQYVDGIDNIVEAHKTVAEAWFRDGSADLACPPVQVLLHVMAYGHWNGKQLNDPAVRNMFTREYLVASDWYKARLLARQQRDIQLWERHCDSLKAFVNSSTHVDEVRRLDIQGRLGKAERKLKELRGLQYLESLVGTIGADPFAG